MIEPAFGDRVQVRPRAGLRVQEHGTIAGRFMPDEWVDRVWDDWLHRRWQTGEILIRAIPEPPVKDSIETHDKSEG